MKMYMTSSDLPCAGNNHASHSPHPLKGSLYTVFHLILTVVLLGSVSPIDVPGVSGGDACVGTGITWAIFPSVSGSYLAAAGTSGGPMARTPICGLSSDPGSLAAWCGVPCGSPRKTGWECVVCYDLPKLKGKAYRPCHSVGGVSMLHYRKVDNFKEGNTFFCLFLH